MNSETNKVRYEFIEGFDTDNPAAIEALGEEAVADVFVQIEEGYTLTDIVKDGDAAAFEYSLFPEFEASLTDPNTLLELEPLSAKNFADLETVIQEQNKLGNDIANVNYTDNIYDEDGSSGVWLAYFRPSIDPGFYTYSENSEGFYDQLRLQSRQDRSLLDVEYGDGTWIATFAESGAYSSISTKPNFSGLTRDITTQENRGNRLVDLEYGDGLWIARFDDNSGDSAFATGADYEIFQEKVAARQEGEFELVDVEYVGNTWYGVFNESEATTIATPTITSPNVPLPSISDINIDPIRLGLPELS